MEKELKHINLVRSIKFSILFCIIGIILFIPGLTGGSVYYLVVGAIFIGLTLVITFLLLFKDPLRLIKKYLQRNPNVALEDIEREFNNSQKFGPRIWVGQHWTVFLNGYGAPDIIEHEKMVWAYKYVIRVNGVKRVFLYTYNVDKKFSSIPFKGKNLDDLLKYYYVNFRVLIGYNKEYQKLIKCDFNRLIYLRYNSNN